MGSEWITDVVVVLIVGALGFALWRASRPRPVFVIRVVDGQPQVVDGTVTPAFLQRVREVAAANAIARATVSGVVHGAFIRLQFSAEINEAGRQQLRNWWATFGWAPPRTGPTGHVG